MIVQFTVSCFRCQSSVFSSIPFLCSGRSFLLLHDWISGSLADRLEEWNARAPMCYKVDQKLSENAGKKSGRNQGKGTANQAECGKITVVGTRWAGAGIVAVILLQEDKICAVVLREYKPVVQRGSGGLCEREGGE